MWIGKNVLGVISVIIAMVTKRGRKPAYKRAEPSTGYCVKCGAPITPGKAFCGSCGARVEEKSPP